MQKYFPFDKNYILKEAQASLQTDLLYGLVGNVKNAYFVKCNPLGLVDDTILQIRACQDYDLTLLENFYAHLAGIYRYKYSSNQLEFLFDGNTHFNKYRKDWEEAFEAWSRNFCQHTNFLKAILEITVFYPRERQAQLAETRLKTFIHQYFELKVYRYKGIVPMKVA